MVINASLYKLIGTTLLLFTIADSAIAQGNVDDVINAEKSFAAYAVQHNSRDAFMLFLDSANGVEFSNGEVGKSYDKWSKRKPDSSKLIWQPVLAGISKSGELGFTTGPWEYKKSANGASVAAGEFATVWHRNDKGEWKYLVDIGTQFNPPAYKIDAITKWTGTYTDIAADDPLTIDRRFIQQYEALHNDAFRAVITSESWFVLPGLKPLMGVQNIMNGLNTILAGQQFMETGGGISSAGDLAYVYGTVRHEDKINNYLRVWQKTKDGYKIILQVLQGD